MFRRTTRTAMCLLVLLTAVGCPGPFYMVRVAPKTEPSPGKALVKIHRPSRFFGRAIRFALWDRDRMVGVSTSGTVVQFECDPGEHLFIATAGNKSAVRAQLMAGKVYDLIAEVRPAMFLFARVKLIPVKKGTYYRWRVKSYDKRLRHIALARRRAAWYEMRHRPGIKAAAQNFDKGKWQRRVKTLSASDHR